MRVAVAGFQHETNTFVSAPTTIDDFDGHSVLGGIQYGCQVIDMVKDSPFATAGFIDELQSGNIGEAIEIVPLLWCFAEPGGPITKDAFNHILNAILNGLRSDRPIDAIYLDLHGAMVIDCQEDGDGEILQAVRAEVGQNTPIITSLDLHGNVSKKMIKHATAMVAYRTYPHIDMRETGRRAARLLHKTITYDRKPAKSFRQLSFLIPLHRQATVIEPCKSIYRLIEEIEADDEEVYSLSFLPGFPLSDIHDCGPSVIAYGASPAVAERAVDLIVKEIAARETDFSCDLLTPDEAVAAALREPSGGTIVIADVQDNAGAGGTSDTVWIIDALSRAKVPDAVVGMIYDPEAAALAHSAGEGAEIRVALGGKLMSGHKPYIADFIVEKLADGPFGLTGAMFGGLIVNLGLAAQLRVGGIRIVVVSARTQCLEGAYFRHVGIEPFDHQIVVVKSTVHYRADFEPHAKLVLEVECPGASIMNPSLVNYMNLRRGVRR